MEPQIVTKPAFTVVGLQMRVMPGMGNFSQLWERFGPRMMEIAYPKPGAAYGIMDNYDETTGEWDYTAAVEVIQANGVPEGMVHVTIPAQTYAVFTAKLPTIGETYKEIYERWLPQSGYQHAPAPEFEYYEAQFDPSNPNSVMAIYVPITAA